MIPPVYGNASEPRTFTMRSPSTSTVRLQVSGQSRVQTLARSKTVMIGSKNEVGHSVGAGGSAKEPIFTCPSDRSVATACAPWSGAGSGFMAGALIEHDPQAEE